MMPNVSSERSLDILLLSLMPFGPEFNENTRVWAWVNACAADLPHAKTKSDRLERKITANISLTTFCAVEQHDRWTYCDYDCLAFEEHTNHFWYSFKWHDSLRLGGANQTAISGWCCIEIISDDRANKHRFVDTAKEFPFFASAKWISDVINQAIKVFEQ